MRAALFLFISGIILLGMQACTGAKSANSGGKLYKTFYAGDQGTQYFIKPLEFNSSDKSVIRMDFTFRYTGTDTSSVTVNYSVIAPVVVKSIDSLVVHSGNTHIAMLNHSLLFNEADNNVFISRFSAKMPLTSLNALMSDQEWVVTPYAPNYNQAFDISRKSAKSLEALSTGLFQVFK